MKREKQPSWPAKGAATIPQPLSRRQPSWAVPVLRSRLFSQFVCDNAWLPEFIHRAAAKARNRAIFEQKRGSEGHRRPRPPRAGCQRPATALER